MKKLISLVKGGLIEAAKERVQTLLKTAPTVAVPTGAVANVDGFVTAKSAALAVEKILAEIKNSCNNNEDTVKEFINFLTKEVNEYNGLVAMAETLIKYETTAIAISFISGSHAAAKASDTEDSLRISMAEARKAAGHKAVDLSKILTSKDQDAIDEAIDKATAKVIAAAKVYVDFVSRTNEKIRKLHDKKFVNSVVFFIPGETKKKAYLSVASDKVIGQKYTLVYTKDHYGNIVGVEVK